MASRFCTSIATTITAASPPPSTSFSSGRGSEEAIRRRLIPKYIMANGALLRVLSHTEVTKYLYFKAIDGGFVYNKGKIQKVPATGAEALKSPLMGIFEKRRRGKFLAFVDGYKEDDPRTHQWVDLNRVSTRGLIAKFSLDDETVDFIGHALALHRDDSYLDEPAMDTVKRMKLYAESMARLGGEIRRISILCMLNKPRCEVELDEGSRAIGVKSDERLLGARQLCVILLTFLTR